LQKSANTHEKIAVAAVALAIGAVLAATGCAAPDEQRPDDAQGTFLFREVSGAIEPAVGTWPDGTFAVPEITGGGVALWDYDADGDLDILHVRFPPPGQPNAAAPNRLYKQELDGSFTDVTDSSGLGDPGYGQGVAVGDVDNDGDPDLFVANYGLDALYLNNGDGTFTDATARSGIEGDLWSSSATFCDYDADGLLDLYVAHYLRFDPVAICLDPSGKRDFCGPVRFDGVADTLYRNNGDASFTDVTRPAGLGLRDGGRSAKGLGVICADLTDDGLVDIYVANDGKANFFWINRGDGTFVEQALIRGVAVNHDGSPESSMGISVGDADGDGVLDLFMTHLYGETNTFYRGRGGRMFSDRTAAVGLGMDDLALTGFGCGFFDYDNDGDLDLAVVNGRVYRGPPLPGASLGPFWNEYAEPNLLFENDGTGRFRNVSDRAGRFTSRVELTRGLAFGDLDDDGDLDLALANGNDTLRIYHNNAPAEGAHWLRVRALTGPRDAIAATVRLVTGERSFLGLVLPGASYISSSDPRVHFGLGSIQRIDSIEVRWPDGSRESFAGSEVDRQVVLRQGTGVIR